MMSATKSRFKTAARNAVTGAAMLGLATGATATAISVTTASLNPAQAQSLLVTPPVAVTPLVRPPAAASKLDEKLCNGAVVILAEYFDVAAQIGKPPSSVLVDSMANWGETGCPYPYEVNWTVRKGDTDKANLDSTLFNRYAGELLADTRKALNITRKLRLPEIDFEKLQIVLAPKPTPLPVVTKPPVSRLEGRSPSS